MRLLPGVSPSGIATGRLPSLTTFLLFGFGTDRLRRQGAMKTASRENPNPRGLPKFAEVGNPASLENPNDARSLHPGRQR